MVLPGHRSIGERRWGNEDGINGASARHVCLAGPCLRLHSSGRRPGQHVSGGKTNALLQLCASGAGIGIASVGLAVVREELPSERALPRSSRSHHDTTTTTHDMTAVAAYPHQLHPTPPFAFSTPPPARSASEGQNGKARSGEARVGQKRILTPRASFSVGMERAGTRDGDDSGSQSGTPTAQPRSWLRRLSSSMSTSRESSQASQSRPGSAAVSQSNGSMAMSHSGSITPIFPDSRTPPPLQPNKLVKRTSSLRSTNGSPLTSSGSRLPMPVFRRPATSHQRSATLQDQLRGDNDGTRMDVDDKPSTPRDPKLRQYFTPKVTLEESVFTRRRSSTGIPNPVKRVYPDRRYTPILVSARQQVKPAQPETDDSMSEDGEDEAVTKLALAPSVASSPLPTHTSHFEEGQTPKRAFSIGDLLSTGPQSPLWRRPSQRQGRSAAKLTRKTRPRIASAPQASMGNALSRDTGLDSEPPAKRRDLTAPQSGTRGIYSSSAGNPQLDHDGLHEIDLHLGSQHQQQNPLGNARTPRTNIPSDVQTPSPLQQQRLPSATLVSAANRPVRVSAVQSEITSSIGSDSDFQSIGDNSTDYQSDAVYDSYPTRTTRSSSGRRGPHIESIFDDSPPNYSSGRSTRLKDLLNDGTYSTGEHDRRYRHSTIEEEGSIVSTPVRSLHTQSVTSTPSARPGAQQQLFGSSPPAMPLMADPDEIDWDAFDDDDERDDKGLGIEHRQGHSHTPQPSLPFRFGPALQHSNHGSRNATPQRSNGDKANLFEWSEVQPSPSHNQSPPRPRTVHGKKDPENRGSRAAGRRAPSGMHARSHSVPVVPDVDGKRTNAVANKFGTWGVGSKAVTEDWNEDFDFEEAPASSVETLKQDEKRIDSGHDMFVPRSIREQQENVVANIGLLREWGLLIEELKELRVRAVALDMMSGPYAHDWYEVDAMIELADQETEENTLEPRRSPPSSPGFDYGEFDEPMPSIASTTRPFTLPDPAAPGNDITTRFVRNSPPSAIPEQEPATTRPRKDSEAVARSVIEALQTKRSVSDPTALKVGLPSKKVPFDTATLRHIVPYVNGLKRKVKDALRETEGLYSSPRRRVSPNSTVQQQDSQEPAFRSIFNEPDSEATAAFRRSRREQAATDHDGGEDPWLEQEGDLASRLRNMRLPR